MQPYAHDGGAQRPHLHSAPGPGCRTWDARLLGDRRGALERLFEAGPGDEMVAALVEAEGAWSKADVEEWGVAREEAWATWPTDRSSTPTS